MIDEMMRLATLQQRVFRCIEDELREDPVHKSFEGAMEVTLTLPNIFADDKSPDWTVTLHAYVLNGMDGRHESWSGRTLAEAIAAAEHGIGKICSIYEMKRFSRQMDAMCDTPAELAGGVSFGGNKHEADDGAKEVPF